MMLAGVGCAGGATGTVGGVVAGVVVSSPGAMGGGATLTFPSRNPSSCKVRLTVPNGCPTKLGITNAGGAAVTVTSRLIFGASTWVATPASIIVSQAPAAGQKVLAGTAVSFEVR